MRGHCVTDIMLHSSTSYLMGGLQPRDEVVRLTDRNALNEWCILLHICVDLCGINYHKQQQ